MIFFCRIFTILEMGIISQQIGNKRNLLALGMGPYFGPKLNRKGTMMSHMVSDFIWDFGKLPFPLHLGKFFKDFGKIIPKIHKIGKI